MFTSQLIAGGTVRRRDIVRAFRVPLATVKRYMKVHRERGRAQALLDEGRSVPEVSAQIGVAGNTLHKAISCGRLPIIKQKR